MIDFLVSMVLGFACTAFGVWLGRRQEREQTLYWRMLALTFDRALAVFEQSGNIPQPYQQGFVDYCVGDGARRARVLPTSKPL